VLAALCSREKRPPLCRLESCSRKCVEFYGAGDVHVEVIEGWGSAVLSLGVRECVSETTTLAGTSHMTRFAAFESMFTCRLIKLRDHKAARSDA
jgi:hypothetical protein